MKRGAKLIELKRLFESASGLREAIEESISIMEFTKERFRNPSEPDIYAYFILLYNYYFRRENT
jgi:hypothetical protein